MKETSVMDLTIDKRSLDLTIKGVTTDQFENEEQRWITIEDPDIVITILGSYADQQKRLIMESVVDNSHTISELLQICKIPLVSAYRKVNSLIQEGLIVENSFAITNSGRRIKYKAVFENLRIDIDGNKIIVKGKLNKNLRKKIIS